MTVLIGDIKDVGLGATDGVVTVFSTVTRRAIGTTGVVTRERREYPLVAGRFRTGELDPGNITVELTAAGVFESWAFDLPTSGVVSLADMLEHVEEYAPPTVNAARAAAAQAELSAQKSAGSAATAERARDDAVQAAASVSRVVDSATGVVRGEFEDLATRAEDAARKADSTASLAHNRAATAERARDAAERARDEAVGAASETAATTANQIRSELAGYAQAAGQSETNARASAGAAYDHAARAEAAAKRADADAQATGTDRVRAEAAAERAVSARDTAAVSQQAASVSQAAAVSAQKASEAARDEAVQAAASAKTGAPESGWPRGSLAQDVRESLTRADSALTSVPRATAQVAGGVKLTGDLAGTWDAPTVPGLAGKLNANQVSTAPTASSIVRRSTGGQVKAAAPVAADDTATKGYVDAAGEKFVPTSKLDYSPTPTTAVLRTSTGSIRASAAVGPTDVVTKSQLEEAARGGQTQLDLSPLLERLAALEKLARTTVKTPSGGSITFERVGRVVTAYAVSVRKDDKVTIPAGFTPYSTGVEYFSILDLSGSPADPLALLTVRGSDNTVTAERINGAAWGKAVWFTD